jgi:hypothetical protein
LRKLLLTGAPIARTSFAGQQRACWRRAARQGKPSFRGLSDANEIRRRRREGRRFQAHYSLSVLAKVANVTHQLLLRILRASGVELIQSGRAVLVPSSEIQKKIPALWKSIELADRQRRAML